MEYVLKLLKKKLRKERVKSIQCGELLGGSGLSGMSQEKMDALEETRNIAKARIIDLQDAIEKLEG